MFMKSRYLMDVLQIGPECVLISSYAYYLEMRGISYEILAENSAEATAAVKSNSE